MRACAGPPVWPGGPSSSVQLPLRMQPGDGALLIPKFAMFMAGFHPSTLASIWCCAAAQVRQAAEVHRQVRSYVQTIAKPGILMTELCEKLEDSGGCSLDLGRQRGHEVELWVLIGCPAGYRGPPTHRLPIVPSCRQFPHCTSRSTR